MKTYVKIIYLLSIICVIIGFALAWVGAMLADAMIFGWAGMSLAASIVLFIVGDVEQYKKPPQDHNPYSL